jgi:glycosyltransferase involved in cell wall biosynthesis
LRKILFFVESLGGGGAEKILTDICRHIDKARFDVTVLSVSAGGVYWDAIVRSGVCVRSVFGRVGGLLYRARYHALVKLPPRLAHFLFVRGCFDTEIAFVEGLATRVISGAPRKRTRLAWVHTDPIAHPHADARYRSKNSHRSAYQRFDGVFCVSEHVRGAFTQKFGSLPGLVVQYNPIDAQAIRARAAEALPDMAYPGGDVLRVIATGRLAPVKGFDCLLRVCAQLRAENHTFSLLILGEGNERSALESLICEHHLDACVRLCGFCENPYPALRGADLYVSASRAEGFSTAAAEALVLGVPVCATDCAGMREVLGGEDCGVLCKPGEEALLYALRSLLSDPGKREALREGAVRRGNQFSMDARMREIEALL